MSAVYPFASASSSTYLDLGLLDLEVSFGTCCASAQQSSAQISRLHERTASGSSLTGPDMRHDATTLRDEAVPIRQQRRHLEDLREGEREREVGGGAVLTRVPQQKGGPRAVDGAVLEEDRACEAAGGQHR